MDPVTKKWNYKVWLARDTEWWRFFGEYSWLVKLIFNSAEESEVTVIARPQLFLIRHTLELGYKMNIVELEKASKLPSSMPLSGKKAHNIEELHRDLNRHFREIASTYKLPQEIIGEYNKLTERLTSLKDVFHKFDKWSFAFRYPVGTDGKTPSFCPNDTLNMAEVREMYIAAEKFLKYTTGVVVQYISLAGAPVNGA